MEAAIRRRLTLADMLVMVAGVGVGLRMTQAWSRPFARFSGRPAGGLGVAIMASCWVAMALSMALLALRLLGPRPRWQALRWQPGFVAGVGTGLGAVFETINFSPYLLESPNNINNWMVSVASPYQLGPSVAIAWAVLVISGRWRPESSWIDRMGRAIGAFWIGGYLVTTVYRFWS